MAAWHVPQPASLIRAGSIGSGQNGTVPCASAFVVARPGRPLDEAEVKRHALANGPAYAHPRRVFFVEALPLSGTNKIDRRLLRERAAEAARAAGSA